jgi:hypothetical protein
LLRPATGMLHFPHFLIVQCVLRAKTTYKTQLLRRPNLHHLSFTPGSCYANQLLRKLASARASFFASRLLHELVFTRTIILHQLDLVHKLAFTHANFTPTQNPGFTPTSVYTIYL